MASSRKPPAADAVRRAVRAALQAQALDGKRIVVALSGGIDSIVLLHALRQASARSGLRIAALHVHHGISANANAWASHCRTLCRRWRIPFRQVRVRVRSTGQGLEAAARAARYQALRRARADAIALAHQLDDQAETVLLNLLRGSGLAGARGMPAAGRLHGKLFIRPLLELPRSAIEAYARSHALPWIEDESNSDTQRTRNFLRHRVAPLLAERFPRWRESLARAARHFAAREMDANRLLREFLAARGLRAPSERRLAEMLRQLTTARAGSRVALRHEDAVVRLHRGRVSVTRANDLPRLAPLRWRGESRLPVPALGGEYRFRRRRGAGMDAARLSAQPVTIRLRAGGERLQPDPLRPRRTLKNLFQESGIPPWERERLPFIFCGAELVFVPGLGVDVRYQTAPRAPGVVASWVARG